MENQKDNEPWLCKPTMCPQGSTNKNELIQSLVVHIVPSTCTWLLTTWQCQYMLLQVHAHERSLLREIISTHWKSMKIPFLQNLDKRMVVKGPHFAIKNSWKYVSTPPVVVWFWEENRDWLKWWGSLNVFILVVNNFFLFCISGMWWWSGPTQPREIC